MNRKHQALNDFFKLLNDKRLQAANVSYSEDATRFDVVQQYAERARLSTGEVAPHYTTSYKHIASIVLENDYSDILERVADVLSILLKDAPLMRLRVSTLSGKRRYTLGVTDSANLEFFGCKNFKCSDDLGAALLDAINDADALTIHGTYSDAFISHALYSYEYHASIFTALEA